MSRGPIDIAMPDRVTSEQVEQALNLLGLTDLRLRRLEFKGGSPQELTVEVSGIDYTMVRTYRIDGYPVRFGPREENTE